MERVFLREEVERGRGGLKPVGFSVGPYTAKPARWREGGKTVVNPNFRMAEVGKWGNQIRDVKRLRGGG